MGLSTLDEITAFGAARGIGREIATSADARGGSIGLVGVGGVAGAVPIGGWKDVGPAVAPSGIDTLANDTFAG
ncbi:hypothetical protein GCM10007874_03430 [Labrys miyagiensis]|uniref:Uncharacterized protein n=1 Tax=Labrys miyagiensis TaxID=346912 RepID=A0ABQ6CAB3_9HYPH|nr:hypothetical protein GCM10007874_03430 [Labrys miyagiensis]